MYRKFLGIAVVAGFVAAGGTAAEARDQIRIVGSSTVYPFATVVAERFGKTTNFKTPVIESTGSGGGLKLFCSGVGVEHPDITNASRRIKKSEVERCGKNGVNDVTEIKVGYDGIVIANAKSADQAKFTKQQIFLALAKNIPDGKGGLKENDNTNWSDIDPSLPNKKIEVLGPPPTSGTRDAFAELALEGGCKTFDFIKAMKKTDKKKYKAVCHGVREDGAYVEAGENDVLIVRKLEANPKAYGVFGYSFLDQNADKVQGSVVEGVTPTFESIADGSYKVSRSLYFYVKGAHVGTIPGIKEYVAEFSSEQAFGEDGYLSDRGLIPMPAAERTKFRKDGEMMANNISF
jgi:phosphate transport system substrate-binding protein